MPNWEFSQATLQHAPTQCQVMPASTRSVCGNIVLTRIVFCHNESRPIYAICLQGQNIEFGVANSSKQNATSGTSSDDKDDAGSATNSSLPGVIQFGGGASTDGDGYTHSTSKVNPDGSITITSVTTGVATNSYNNGSLTRSQVKTLQKALGVAVDGYYGNASRAAAGGLDADAAYKKFVKNTATAVNRRAGDMNGDGKVNLSDCSQFLKLMQKPSSCTANDIKYGDLNHDGVLNYADYSCMLRLAKGK